MSDDEPKLSWRCRLGDEPTPEYECHLHPLGQVEVLAVLRNGTHKINVGYARGCYHGNGTAELWDIRVYCKLKLKQGFFGIIKTDFPLHGRGTGSELLKHFEAEIVRLGMSEITGNLPAPDIGDLNFLIPWYERHGYEVDQTITPDGFSGTIRKKLI